MSNIDKRALREAAERAESDSWGYDRDEFNEALTPAAVLALLDELEAAEKLIAELEAREVVLPSVQDVHPLGPQSAKVFCEFHRSIVNRCADEIRKVGVKVSIKGA
ncbi:ead/Ea22-like family protein [Enterobacter cloacae complex sp.]|nr:ead/Ea22-like family protein [Enterobacter cloacae complex sp.]